MAGLISGPKPPRQPQIIYVPQDTQGTVIDPVSEQIKAGTQSSSSTDSSSQNQGQGSISSQTLPSSSKDGTDTADVSSGAGGANDTQASTGGQPQKSKNEERAANLLSAQRGRQSTILTSFRGVLEEKDKSPRRKTLLGE
mgnify:CR=1 FL=1